MTTCSPKIRENASINTCYSKDELIKISKSYNNSHPDKIKLNSNKLELWNQLKKKNFNTCKNNEFCWLKQNYIKINDELKDNFRPEKPVEWNNEPNKWLNTNDILNVMEQYEMKYKNFKMIGVFPIDFKDKIEGSCVSPLMCKLNLNELIKNKNTKLGFVFNLDKHYQSGSHWTSMFINLNKSSKNFGAYYYDSVGTKPPSEITDFIKILKKQSKKIFNKELPFKFNKIQHQTGNSECGMFSLYYLDKSLKNTSFNDFVNKKNLNDNLVSKHRDLFYTKST
mgnify:CR=1 FL=1|jgi:hypothetical protein|tara:strand:- start:8501 stop:9343 length:843 start_codon:yes stop_codon:yes gene_type:complete